MSAEARLAGAVRQLGIELSDAQHTKLLSYVQLIAKWNKVYNLTAVRPNEMLVQHLFDSLSVVGPLKRQAADREIRFLDVGSGAGLPGVVVAICCPAMRVDCVDTVGKKAAFVQQAAAQLQLPNLRGVHDRVENLAGPYDVIASRAFASLPDFVNLSSGALDEQGVWMAMKGKKPDDEIAALPAEAQVFHVEQLSVPELDAERCLVWMRKRSRAQSATGLPGTGS